jgi:uncharacterized membrane protein
MWVNHHHLIHIVREVNARVLWSNNFLLFWMSLIPFTTGFMGENHLSSLPVCVYGIDLCACGFGFFILRGEISRQTQDHSTLEHQNRKVQLKNLTSTLLYVCAAVIAWFNVWISYAIYVFVAVSYFLPEKVIEEAAKEGHSR